MIFYIDDCEERIGYSFKDKNLLRTCFTHSSWSHEHSGTKDNERLEFFGDAILGFVVTEYLVTAFPNADEGTLTEYKQKLVSKKPLSEATIKAGLDEFIIYGEGERKSTPEKHVAAAENLFEAIIAGIYLDGGLEPASKFIYSKLLKPKGRSAAKKIATANYGEDKHPKNALQEYIQKNKLGDLEWVEISRQGPSHDLTLTMAVTLNGKEIARGVGKSKGEATKKAAEKACKSVIQRRKPK